MFIHDARWFFSISFVSRIDCARWSLQDNTGPFPGMYSVMCGVTGKKHRQTNRLDLTAFVRCTGLSTGHDILVVFRASIIFQLKEPFIQSCAGRLWWGSSSSRRWSQVKPAIAKIYNTEPDDLAPWGACHDSIRGFSRHLSGWCFQLDKVAPVYGGVRLLLIVDPPGSINGAPASSVSPHAGNQQGSRRHYWWELLINSPGWSILPCFQSGQVYSILPIRAEVFLCRPDIQAPGCVDWIFWILFWVDGVDIYLWSFWFSHDRVSCGVTLRSASNC